MIEESTVWGIPHFIKIPEAYSALTDKRYEYSDGYFKVFSSNRTRMYSVEVFHDGYASNDNMSVNKNILGYPIVLHLLLHQKISFDASIANLFGNINWTELNLLCKKDFTVSYNVILQRFSERGLNSDLINVEIQSTYNQLCELIPTIKKYKSRLTFEESLIEIPVDFK